MKKLLINISNHPSNKWTEEQKADFDEIIDIPAPQIPPDMSAGDVSYVVDTFMSRFDRVYFSNKDCKKYLCLLGEYTFCYLFLYKLISCGYIFSLAIPTTERVVEEKQTPEGVVKTSVFKFVRWRIIDDIYFD